MTLMHSAARVVSESSYQVSGCMCHGLGARHAADAACNERYEGEGSQKEMVVRTTLEDPPWSPSGVLVQPSAL